MLRYIPVGLFLAALGAAGCNTCSKDRVVAERPYTCNYCDSTAVQPPPAIRFQAPRAGRVAPPPTTFAAPPAVSEKPPPSTAEPPLATEKALAAEGTPPGVKLGPPGPVRRDSGYGPESTKEPPIATVPGTVDESKRETLDKDVPDPIDLPGFSIAVPGVASGLRPGYEGIPWLAKKYKTVLHLREPREDTAAARKQFEKAGLTYVSLEATPARLTKELYEQFVKQVKAADSHPLFVYDKDGSVAGGLWYLYLRVEEKQDDEKARAEAQRLGLKFEEIDEHKAMWLAVQKLLESLKPEA